VSGDGRGKRPRRRDFTSREQAKDAAHRARAARQRVAWDRDARLAGVDEDDPAHVQLGDGDRLRPAPAPDELSGVLARIVQERGWGERLRGASLHGIWPQIVGEDLAQRCRPGRLAGGTLVVVVESPRWATQLRYLEHVIAARVGEAVGAEVREVRVVVGDVDDAGT